MIVIPHFTLQGSGLLFGLLTFILIVLFNLYFIQHILKLYIPSCVQARRTFVLVSLPKTPRQVILILLHECGDANYDSDRARAKNQIIIIVAGLSEKDHF